MDLLTVSETAQALRVSPITVRRYIASGRLPAVRVGRGIRVRRDDLEEMLEPLIPNGEPFTFPDPLQRVVGLGGSGEPAGAAEQQKEVPGNARASRAPDELTLASGVSLGKPTTEADPLWNIVGMIDSGESNDVARNKHKNLSETIFADKFGKE